jgi:hypothetical protein
MLLLAMLVTQTAPGYQQDIFKMHKMPTPQLARKCEAQIEN